MKNKLTFWSYFKENYLIVALFIMILSIISFTYAVNAGFVFLSIILILIILSYNKYKKYKKL